MKMMTLFYSYFNMNKNNNLISFIHIKITMKKGRHFYSYQEERDIIIVNLCFELEAFKYIEFRYKNLYSKG